MAFRPARPLSHHTNLQLTDAAADAIERIFVLRAALERETLISSIRPANAFTKQHLCWKIAIKHRCSHRCLSINIHRHHGIGCKVFTAHEVSFTNHVFTRMSVHACTHTLTHLCKYNSFTPLD